MAMHNQLDDLVQSIWQEVASRQDRRTGHRIDMPPVVLQEEPVSEARFSQSFPVLQHLGRAIGLSKSGALADIAARFEPIAHALDWSQNANYTSENCSITFLNGYAYAGLSGPDGPLFWAAPRTGIMLMGPHVLYPSHHHKAREFYLPMTPGAQWRLDNGDWFDVDAGELIYHDAWQMHEMRTHGEPLLALAGWIEAGDRGSIAWHPERRGAIA